MFFQSARNRLHKNNFELLNGLDIGSSKVSCCITRPLADGTLEVLGIGQQASKGIRAGSIIDIQSLELAIRGAVHAAEVAANTTINDVFVSLSASLTTSVTIKVDSNISGHAVDDHDVRKIIAQAAQLAEKPNHEIIHSIAALYSVDATEGIRDPRGMYGDTLSCSILFLMVQNNPLRNLYACVERCHLNVNGFVVSPYASGLATLVPDELELGTVLIDMGAGSTAISIFQDGSLVHVDYIPMGGVHVTNDIARGLSTPLAQAERIKTLYGSAMVSPSDHRELIAAPQIGEDTNAKGSQVSKAEVTRIIRPRIEETFELIRDHLHTLQPHHMTSNRFVLTGGACQLSGVRELASMILNKQGRLGRPLYITSQTPYSASPAFATCSGLLEFARSKYALSTQLESKDTSSFLNRFGKIGAWFKEHA